MPQPASGYFESLKLLPEQERMRRISALVCRATLKLSEAAPMVTPAVEVLAPTADAGSSGRVLAYLDRVREASPVETRLSLGLSRSTVFRSLQQLVTAGQAATRGHTKSVVYRVVTP